MKPVSGQDKDFADVHSLARYREGGMDLERMSEKAHAVMHPYNAKRLLAHYVGKSRAERRSVRGLAP